MVRFLKISEQEYEKLEAQQRATSDVAHKIAGRNINNLRYADDTTLMAESEEELRSLLMKVKRGEKKLA